MTLRFVYIAAVVVIFLTEIAIAVGLIGGAFVRGSIGDILVIALIYFLLRAITGLSPHRAVALAIAMGFLVEVLQYIHVAELINIGNGSILYTVVGNTFSLFDLIMYVVGGSLALVIDKYMLLHLLNNRVHKPHVPLVL